MSIQDQIKNANLISGNLKPVISNEPEQYHNRQKQYFADETSAFVKRYAKYASDFVDAEVQGLDPTDFYAWQKQRVRMADIVRPTAAATRIIDDHKIVLFESNNIDYFPAGAKLVTMGSTWLAINPQNISNVVGSGLVRRCNAVWNYLDYYGNICSEPIIIQKPNTLANENDEQAYVLITKGYFDVIAQYNPATAQLGQNSRIILGSAAYAVTGFSDFISEFTGDYDSIHLVYFSLRYQEPNETDDLVNHVAGGNEFTWNIEIEGKPVLAVGDTVKLSALSVRNGGNVISTSQFPIGYIWTSSNVNIATVDVNGNVTAISEGNCIITATLQQNCKHKASYEITVAGSAYTPHVEFLSTVPAALQAYEETEITAVYYENGKATPDTVLWDFSGADEAAYSVNINGSSISIRCWEGSVNPLQIKAICNGVEITAEIKLEGI